MLDQHNTNDTVSGCLQATGASSESCTTSEAGAGSPQQLPARPPRPLPPPLTPAAHEPSGGARVGSGGAEGAPLRYAMKDKASTRRDT